MSKPLNIGMIGYGFMGRAHSNAYAQVSHFFETKHKPVLKAVCARDEAKAKAFAAQWGYESVETDWRKLVARKDIDAVDICVPNNLHAEIAIEAARNGKMILCEKPLAMTAAEGRRMVDAVEKAKVANTVWYNYRRIPAVTLAKRLVDEGRLGKVFHYRAKFLQDWTIRATCRRAGRASGGWTSTRPGPGCPGTCWPTASTRPSGSTGGWSRSAA
jgi:predicted dehydrogenase